jgi:putative aldouronate transport system substrate-binding protein
MKRILAFILCAVMVSSLFVGCSKQEAASGSSSAATVSQAAASASTEPVTLTMMAKDMPADDAVTIKLLKSVGEGVSKKLGREVTIKMVPMQDGTYSDTMALSLQSGTIPDLMYFQGGDYQFAITQKILEDLTPYINGSTYVKAMMQPYNNERIKNYPYLMWLSPDRTKVPVIRTDWLTQCKTGAALQADPSIENYTAFLKELKEKFKLSAAITVPNDLSEIDTIFNLAFGVTQTWVKGSDGKYIYSKVSDGEKAKLAFYAKLYKEGLLDNTYLTQKWDTKEKAFYDGKVGVVSGTQGAVIKVYDNKMTAQNGAGSALTVLPPAKGVAQGYTPSDVSKESRGWAIAADSKNKDVAFAVLEYMASPEGQLLDKLGYNDEEYKIDGNKIVLTDKFAQWYPRFHESIATFNPTTPLSEKTPYYPASALSALDMVKKYNTYDNTFVMPDQQTTNWDACQALYLEYTADVISGKKSIDTFGDFVNQWNKLGGKEITEYANTVIK